MVRTLLRTCMRNYFRVCVRVSSSRNSTFALSSISSSLGFRALFCGRKRSLADGWNAHLARLKNKEVLDILNRAGALGFDPLGEVVTSALSGQLILYDRSTVKHFR